MVCCCIQEKCCLENREERGTAHLHHHGSPTHATIWSRSLPNQAGCYDHSSDHTWLGWTPLGQTPSQFLQGSAWMSHSTHCARLVLLQLSNPISTFITLVQPQNFPIMSASQFLTLAAPNFSPTLSQHIWNANLNHSMILSLKFIRRTYGRPFFFKYLATGNNLKTLPHANMRQHSFYEAIFPVLI